ncbi:MAG TPA: isochorismatase family cysteine hydrolase [Edaphobacter sp.]|nr:isochorismatase family cysteine hydrolase [Edaphobacter sp.]
MRSRKHAQTSPSPVPVALLLIDVVTTFQFPDGDAILQGALAMRDALVRLKARARALSIPVLYVNDNFGDWRSEKEVLMGRCLEAKGAQFVRPLLPDSEDYFVLKPMHSAFYMTPLEVLLEHLQVETLILTGLTSNSCITVTAHDANMRGFDIFVPSDCSCARNPKEHIQALTQLEAMAGANVRASTSLKLPNLIRAARTSQRTNITH